MTAADTVIVGWIIAAITGSMLVGVHVLYWLECRRYRHRDPKPDNVLEPPP